MATQKSKLEQIRDLHAAALKKAKEERESGNLHAEGHALGEAAGLRQALAIYEPGESV